MSKEGSARHSPILRLPWWGSVLLAVFFYCGLTYGVPLLHPANPTLQHLAQAAPSFAPILTIALLLLAAKQLYATDIPKDDSQKQEKPPEE